MASCYEHANEGLVQKEILQGNIFVSGALFSKAKKVPELAFWYQVTCHLLDSISSPGWPGIPSKVHTVFMQMLSNRQMFSTLMMMNYLKIVN